MMRVKCRVRVQDRIRFQLRVLVRITFRVRIRSQEAPGAESTAVQLSLRWAVCTREGASQD